MSRLREYTLYATARGGAFTTYSVNYSKGTHPWIYKVRAISVRQAYALAAREAFAQDARSAGVREIDHDCHHYDYEECRQRPGHHSVAPYLEKEDRSHG